MNEQIKNNSDAYRNDDGNSSEAVIRNATSVIFANTLQNSICRNYLSDSTNLMLLDYHTGATRPITWLKLEQVGIKVDVPTQEYLMALERLLQSLHVPGKMRLLFLVSCDARKIELRFGIQAIDLESKRETRDNAQILSDFAAVNWPGVVLKKEDAQFNIDVVLSEYISSETSGITALTGLPSNRSDHVQVYPVTIDKLAGSMSRKKWVYMVIAEPVSENELNEVIYKCNDLAGRAESLKSFNYSNSKGDSEGKTNSVTETTGKNYTITDSTSEKFPIGKIAESCKKYLGIPEDISKGTIAVAGGIAAGKAAAGIAMTAAAAGGAMAAAPALVPLTIGVAAAGILLPTKTHSKSLTESSSNSLGISTSFTVNSNETISNNVINKHMEMTSRLLTVNLERYQLSRAVGAWQVGAYFIGENENETTVGGRLLKAVLSGDESNYEPIRLHNLTRWIDKNNHIDPNITEPLLRGDNPNLRIGVDGDMIYHPFGNLFQSLQTVLNTRELAKYVNFPTTPVPGIEVMPVPEEASQRARELSPEKISLGNLVYAGEVRNQSYYPIELNQFTKHALVCGITGAGKSNTVKHILNELLNHRESGGGRSVPIPFLLIEPAKDEYVSWAMKINQKNPGMVNVFVPGRTNWRGKNLPDFKLNPFDIIWLNESSEPRVLEHIDRLKTIVNSVLPMQEVLPVLMEELVYGIYLDCWKKKDDGYERAPDTNRSDKEEFFSWLNEDCSLSMDMPRPTFRRMGDLVTKTIITKGYEEKISKNLNAALKTRIASFTRGWRDSILNCGTLDKAYFKTLFDRPTVINLTALSSDEDKKFFMSVLFQFLYEYRQAQHDETGEDYSNTLRHLLVIEEAHRILGNTPGKFGEDSAQNKLAEMFSNMISEIRAYGQGILIADQVPNRLNVDAIKNTNLKIVHRLVANDDREVMRSCLDLNDSHTKLLATLKPGYAMIRGDMDNSSAWVKIPKVDI